MGGVRFCKVNSEKEMEHTFRTLKVNHMLLFLFGVEIVFLPKATRGKQLPQQNHRLRKKHLPTVIIQIRSLRKVRKHGFGNVGPAFQARTPLLHV